VIRTSRPATSSTSVSAVATLRPYR
jgi:hypothetical protein